MPDVVRQLHRQAVHASPTAGAVRPRVVTSAAIGLAASLMLALLGALGTDAVPFGLRLLYWAAVVLPGSALGVAITWAVRLWGGLAGRPWAEVLLVAVLVTIPHTFLVIVASALMFGVDTITPQLVAQFGFAVLIVSVAMTSINHMAARTRELGSAAPTVPMPEPPLHCEQTPMAAAMPSAFADRLPLKIRGGRLHAICAQDHYLMVHTDIGSDLVLMRMADAVALLAGVPGARVHRSWWVARAAVIGSRTGNGNPVLLVAGGLEVPVSRGARAAAVDAGLLPA